VKKSGDAFSEGSMMMEIQCKKNGSHMKLFSFKLHHMLFYTA